MNEVSEVWLDIINYEGIYAVSNLGRVKSLKFNKERILKASKDKNGYRIVRLFLNGVAECKSVHRLVMQMFKGYDDRGNVNVVDHINMDRADNRLSNLRVISNRDNVSRGMLNRTKTSKYIGVHMIPSGKFNSQIKDGPINIYLGTFDNEYDAHLRYQEELKRILESNLKENKN